MLAVGHVYPFTIVVTTKRRVSKAALNNKSKGEAFFKIITNLRRASGLALFWLHSIPTVLYFGTFFFLESSDWTRALHGTQPNAKG